ncbi:intercellular adhesion molecule 5 [Heliangelus exortis]|uniref:intercellular adhesion molecule 5 n=1 Tax=Heliangelus exortis TaxID=472823 RepID=UPI003A8E81D6
MAPPLPSPRLLPPLLLALAGAARGTWSVVAWPRVAVVAFGGSVAINCSLVACPVANGTLGLETPLEVAPGATGTHWRIFRLLNVTRWDPPPVTCWGHCGDEGDKGDNRDKATAGVIVYKLPAGVVLEPVAAVAVGDTWNLTCHVLEVAPVSNLTVTLRRGTETLGTGRWQPGDTQGSANVTFGRPLTASPGDNGQDVTCHAELSLGHTGRSSPRAAVPVTLEVFALPAPPQLLVPSLLEFGVTSAASCRVTGAFPVPRLRVSVALAGQDLNLTVTSVGDVVTAATTLSPTAPGRQEVTCRAEVATVARTARSLLHVYSFPPPLLEVSPRPVAAGREVLTLRCHSDVTDPPAALLQLLDVPGGVLAQGPPPGLSLRLVARRDDDKRRVGCRASLAVGDTQVTKDTETQLDVLFPPQMSPSDCPRTLTWLRGTRVTLSCGATGNPPPVVTCARHGVPVPAATPQLVTRSRAGTYVCNATNALGTRSQEVTVRVESEPTLTERGCPSHVTWVEGAVGDFGCQAEGDPPATTLCSRPGEGPQGGPRPKGPVSRTQAGRYLCRASNKHGVATRSVLVTVEYEPHLGDRGCPAWRRWVEGTPAVLSCAATGNPPPRVTCSRLGGGDPPEMILGTHPWKGDPRPPPTPTPHGHPRSRGDLRVPGEQREGNSAEKCHRQRGVPPGRRHPPRGPLGHRPPGWHLQRGVRGRGVPSPQLRWALPPAPNLLLAPDNRSVTVTAATATNGGRYTCTATNPHGHRAASVLVHVQESWVALVATLASLGATTLVALLVAGLWYLKSTACKKGEYNVRDAEGAASSHRPRRHRPRRHRCHRPEVYGIQLAPPPP